MPSSLVNRLRAKLSGKRCATCCSPTRPIRDGNVTCDYCIAKTAAAKRRKRFPTDEWCEECIAFGFHRAHITAQQACSIVALSRCHPNTPLLQVHW